MKDLNIELYKKMYLIRRAEEKIQVYYPKDEMKTPMHMSMGEEAIVVGVCSALNPHDQVLGTYRSHALYLAKSNDTDAFFAELYGKSIGGACGKAGSMHLSSPENGLLCCSAIVGSPIPVAVGAALANKYNGDGVKVAVFFGDGAVDAGAFWESINFACLKRLPVLFINEDNGLAVHTPKERRQGFSSVSEVVSKFDCNVFEESSTDVENIFKLTRMAIETSESNEKPSFLRFKYYRYLEHVGIDEDFDAGYRSREGFLEWHHKDPVIAQRNKLLENGVRPEDVVVLEKEIEEEIMRSIQRAKAAEFADLKELDSGVFQCD